jgi:DNA replication factor GINS
MYSELFAAWKAEVENSALQPLPADFYTRVSSYLRQIKAENHAPDKNAVKASLMEQERRNAARMVKELLRTRYKKILKTVKGGQKLLPEILTNEESEFMAGLLPFAEAYSTFTRGLLQGQTPKPTMKSTEPRDTPPTQHKRVVVRFVKAIPAIVGSDMQTYGPFQPEDVASVPELNAKILVKQGLAQIVEVS